MKKKILVADDSASMRQLVSFTLTGAGYAVISASDGSEALSLARSVDFDMVVTDLNMPKLDGVGLVKSIRQMEKLRHTPVVMLTTENREGLRKESSEAGASEWLTKPFTPDTLLSTIRKFIG